MIIKNIYGDSIFHQFKKEFYADMPFALVSCVQDKYLLFGKENIIDVSAPGIPVEKLIISATNADLKVKSGRSGPYYVIIPRSKKDVEVSISTRNNTTFIPLCTWRMTVISEFPDR